MCERTRPWPLLRVPRNGERTGRPRNVDGQEVVARFDHRNINYAVEDFEPGKQIPTVEALALYVWNKIKRRLPPGVSLECVRIQEDPTLYAEYRGER